MTGGDDRALRHPRLGRDAMVHRAIEDDVLVDLVGIHADVGATPLPDHLGDRGELDLGQHATRRVGRRAEDDDFRAWRDPSSQVLRGERKPRSLAKRQRDGRRAHVGDPGLVDRKPRARVDDLVAGIDVRLHRKADRWLATGRNDDSARVCGNAARARDMRRHSGPERGSALGVRVVRVTSPDLSDRRLVDVRRAVEIGLTDVQAHDIHPAGDTPRDVVADPECVLGTQRAHTGGQQCHQYSVAV